MPDGDYTTMIFAGSLHASITPLRQSVRTRTQTVVPGTMPLTVALPPLSMPAYFQLASTVGPPVQVCTLLADVALSLASLV